MTINEDSTKKITVFNETFAELLNTEEKPNQKAQEVVQETDAPVLKPEGELEDILFGTPDDSGVELSGQQHILEIPDDYIPEHVGDPEWEAFASRQPFTPLTREQEHRAVSIGLQEIRKMKEFMTLSYQHQTNEFNRVYAVFPLLFSKDFDEVHSKEQMELLQAMNDVEHLLVGDYDNVEAVKKDFTLTQAYDEKRQSILHAILAYYNNKN